MTYQPRRATGVPRRDATRATPPRKQVQRTSTPRKPARPVKRRRRGSPLTRLGRGFYRLLVVLSVVVILLWGAWKLASRRPTVAQESPRTPQVAVTTAPDAAPVSSEEPEPQPEETPPPPVLIRKEGTWTFLIAAEDQVSGSADTIMICTYDTVNQKIGLASVPRDTLVVRKGWTYHKLNASYSNGNIAYPPDGGIRELRDAVSEVVGYPLDHYVMVDTKLFVSLVDAVGGVDFNVPIYMNYDAPDQNLHIHFKPGMQHLNGQQAMEVVRCRKNSDGPGEYPDNCYDAYPDADIGRTRTQQEMVKTIAKKVLQNPQKAPGYLELMSKYIKTDLSLGNLLWFLDPALSFDFADLTTTTLPGNGMATYQRHSVYELDKEACLAFINEHLNPYTTPITEDMVSMVRGDR